MSTQIENEWEVTDTPALIDENSSERSWGRMLLVGLGLLGCGGLAYGYYNFNRLQSHTLMAATQPESDSSAQAPTKAMPTIPTKVMAAQLPVIAAAQANQPPQQVPQPLMNATSGIAPIQSIQTTQTTLSNQANQTTQANQSNEENPDNKRQARFSTEDRHRATKKTNMDSDPVAKSAASNKIKAVSSTAKAQPPDETPSENYGAKLAKLIAHQKPAIDTKESILNAPNVVPKGAPKIIPKNTINDADENGDNTPTAETGAESDQKPDVQSRRRLVRQKEHLKQYNTPVKISSTLTRLDPLADNANWQNRLDTNADDAEAHFYLANDFARQNRWQQAQLHYLAALNISTAQPDINYNFAVSLEHLGQSQMALAQYQAAVHGAAIYPVHFNRDEVHERIRILQQQLIQ